MKSYLINLDSDIGKKIGLTSDMFTDLIAWDYSPHMIYITSIWPVKGREEEAYTALLEKLAKIATPVEFTAPSELLRTLAKKYCYDAETDPAGTPRINNKASKFLK